MTEGTCELAVRDRTGMRWSQGVTLRALRVSDPFDTDWKGRMRANSARLAA